MGNKKGLILATSLIGAFSLILGGAIYLTGRNNQLNYYQKTVAAQNSLVWNAVISDLNTGAGESLGISGEGYTFVTKSKRAHDYDVKLAKTEIPVVANKDYRVSFTFTSTTTATGNEKDGAVLRVYDGGDLWRRFAVESGSNTLVGYFHATANAVSIELNLGEFCNDTTIVVKSFELTVRSDVEDSKFNAEAWQNEGKKYYSSVVSNPALNISSATFSFNNSQAQGEFHSYENKLQVLTFATLSAGKTYHVSYKVTSTINLAGCEIVHGVRPNLDYTEKWAVQPDGYYGQEFTTDIERTFEFDVTPNTDFVDVVISFRPGEMKTGNITISGVKFAEYVHVHACDFRSATSFINSWKALRVEGNLCEVGADPFKLVADEAAMRNLIAVYDNLDPSQRTLVDEAIDTGDYTIAQSIAYFREKLAA